MSGAFEMVEKLAQQGMLRQLRKTTWGCVMKDKKSRIWASLTAIVLALASAACGAQNFAAPHCERSTADSTCFTAARPTSCGQPEQVAGQTTNCPTGYVGKVVEEGMRNMCTGTVVWNPPGGDLPSCTNCPNPLTANENQAMFGSVLEASERVNLAFVDYMYPGFAYLDGAAVKNPLTGMQIGRMFRDHVWASPDGFASGALPTTNRIRYLLSRNEIPSNLPPSNILPKDPNGNPITNAGELYLRALTGALESGATSCVGNGMNGCNISCSTPTTGWQERFCETRTVAFRACSDSYAVNNGTSWQPTKSVEVPYASTNPHNYAATTWDWQTVFGWNGVGNSGGAVFLCNDTIKTCNGWQTQTVVYEVRTPASYACTYPNPVPNGPDLSGTCTSTDPAMGAIWDYKLTQYNDCPLVPGQSTRAYEGQPRVVWQSDLPACF